MTVLQPRDAVLLNALSRYGLLSTRQVANRLFNGVAHTTVMRRLRKLEALGLILRRPGLSDSSSAWSITQEAGTLLGKENVPHYTNRNIIEHEVTLSGLRMALESVGLGESWTSETELRRKMGFQRERSSVVVPDGLFVANQQSKPCVVALELELNAKGHSRYNHILKSYRYKSSITYLWYVVPQFAIGKTVIERSINIRNAKFTLIVSLLDEVLTDPASARIFTADAKSMALKHYFDLSHVQEVAQGLSIPSAVNGNTSEEQILTRNQALPPALT